MHTVGFLPNLDQLAHLLQKAVEPAAQNTKDSAYFASSAVKALQPTRRLDPSIPSAVEGIHSLNA